MRHFRIIRVIKQPVANRIVVLDLDVFMQDLKSGLITLALLLAGTSVTTIQGKGDTLDLSKTVIVHSGRGRQAAVAKFLETEIELRTGIKLAGGTSMPSGGTPAVVIGTAGSAPAPYNLPRGLAIPAKCEGYAIWADTSTRSAPTVYLLGRDDRGTLFAAGRLMRLLYLAENYIALAGDVRIGAAPADAIRAHQIISTTQSRDRLIDWGSAARKRQYIRDLVIFGTNGFETRFADNVDDYLEELGIDFFLNVTCQDLIDRDRLSDNEIRDLYAGQAGLDHITTYGGDARGAMPPQLVFPKMERIVPLIMQTCPTIKWWYSNQCLDFHAVDYDDYIFGYLKTTRPSWLYGMVYGPWTKRGIAEIRADLPASYAIRHYPDICHPWWCQYPVGRWDRVLAQVWPRNGSIYAMPRMMAAVHKATRKDTEGFLAYNHTGCYNDLNKFVWSAAGWDPSARIEDILYDYGRVFFAYQFREHPESPGESVPKDAIIDAGSAAVARGLQLLEENWTGPLADNTSAEEALALWKKIAGCMGGVGRNWRLELFLYRAFIDAQIKRKYDAEMKCQRRAYEILQDAAELKVPQNTGNSDGERKVEFNRLIENARAELAKVDTQFQSRESFTRQLRSWDLSGKFGDLDEILDNLYKPLSDRRWLQAKLDGAGSAADIDRILNYENAGPGGYYDNLGVEGGQPHLVRQKTWREDPGFVYSPVNWTDHKPGADRRHSQLTHALCRYDTPLLMRWERLDPAAAYHIEVVYLGPFGQKLTCQTDEGVSIHTVRGNTGSEPVRYDIPRSATADGVLELKWKLDNQVRGVSVTEIWLIKD